jgi:hypothetical protein
VAVKFKLAPRVGKDTLARLMDALEHEGFKADQMFPSQRRPALRRLYIIRSRQASVAKVKKAIAALEDAVDYIEGDVVRKPMG